MGYRSVVCSKQRSRPILKAAVGRSVLSRSSHQKLTQPPRGVHQQRGTEWVPMYGVLRTTALLIYEVWHLQVAF